MFAALGHPHRLALFRQLCTCCTPGVACGLEQVEGMCVGDLAEGLDIAPSTLSHHLKTLRLAGLVVTERQGKRVLCSVDPSVLSALSAFFSEPLSGALTLTTDCCPPGVTHV